MPNQKGRRLGKNKKPQSAFKPNPRGVHLPGQDDSISKEDIWREIEQLRLEVNELRASSLAPRFCGLSLLNLAPGSHYVETGFQPYACWAYGQFSSGATLTLSVGCWTHDDDTDGGFVQFATAIRRSNAGEWRNNTNTAFVAMLADDDSTQDNLMSVTDIDSNGFTVSVTGGAIAVVRGFVIGR